MQATPMKKIQLTIPEELLDQVDAAARASYRSRSAFLREALIAHLAAKQFLTADALRRLQEAGVEP